MNNKRKKMFDIKEFLRIYGSRKNIDYRKCKNFLKDFYNIVNNHIYTGDIRSCSECYSYFTFSKTGEKTTRKICHDFARNIPVITDCKKMKKAIKYFIDNYDNSDIFLEIE
jgi:phage anti-repressor protein